MNYPVLPYWVMLINTVQLNLKLIKGFLRVIPENDFKAIISKLGLGWGGHSW